MQDNNKLENSVEYNNADNESNEPNNYNTPVSPIDVIINQYDIIHNQSENIEQEIEENQNNEELENSEENYADNEHEEEHYDIYYHPFNMLSNLVNINPNSNVEINNRVNVLMEEASNKLFTTPEDLNAIIEISYLSNLQYTDELSNLIKYTIRTAFRDTHQFQISDVIAAILTYSLSQINVVFNDNYTLVYEILVDEIKRLISRSYTFMLLSDMIMNSPQGNMENIKLTVKPEIIEGITRKKFKEYESNIKEVNTKCTVCQACFEGEDDTRILNCNHVYHTDCIDNWLTNYNYLCPCCREPAAEHFANLS
jgi:hypothetical protein